MQKQWYTYFLILSLAVSFSTTGWGQDIHFSQFYSSPLTLNPALTGGGSKKYRIAANYRSQWNTLHPFITYAASFDASILQSTVKNDIAGLGIVAMNDQVESGGVKNLQLLPSVSYHVSLGKNNNHYIATGLQAGLVQRSFNPNNLLFPNQWSPSTGKSAQISSGESFKQTSTLFFDMSAGLMWYSFLGKGSNVFLGGAVFHPHTPTVSFISEENTLSRRYLLQGGAKISTGPKFNIAPNLLFMQQSEQREINLGTSFEFAFPKANGLLSIGGWYRFHDAVIAALSFQYKSYKLGLSYDINISELQTATQNRGGFEISLIIGIPGAGEEVDVETHPGPKI